MVGSGHRELNECMAEICHTSPVHPLQSLPDLSVADLLALPAAASLSLVTSLDGQICGPDGSARTISGPEDLRLLRLLRAASDVIVVSARTAAREQYPALHTHAEFTQQRLSAGLPRDPHVVVITRTGDVSACRPEFLAAANTTVMTTNDYPAALATIRSHFGQRVLAEVGGTIIGNHPGVHERIWLSLSPTLVGDQGHALSISLDGYRCRTRYVGRQFVLQRFER